MGNTLQIQKLENKPPMLDLFNFMIIEKEIKYLNWFLEEMRMI